MTSSLSVAPAGVVSVARKRITVSLLTAGAVKIAT